MRMEWSLGQRKLGFHTLQTDTLNTISEENSNVSVKEKKLKLYLTEEFTFSNVRASPAKLLQDAAFRNVLTIPILP